MCYIVVEGRDDEGDDEALERESAALPCSSPNHRRCHHNRSMRQDFICNGPIGNQSC